MSITHGLRDVRRAALPMVVVAGLCASAAFAADGVAPVQLVDSAPASTAPVPVLTATGVDGRALKLHLAQTLGPDSARESQRFSQTVWGEEVRVGVSRGSTLAGPTFAARNPQDSGAFQRSATTGELGLLNVAWLGLRRIGAE